MTEPTHDPADWADFCREAQEQLLAQWSRLAPGAAGSPALGLTREQQEAAQRLHQLQTDYTVQQARLAALWSQVVAEALKDLGERVSERLRDGQAVAPGRPTYDLWIECAEEQFARAAHSTDYAKAQADLANTAARLRIEQRRAVEVLSRQLDLPTRAELDTVHRRIKTLTAQLRALEDQLPPARKPERKPASKPARKAARTRGPARP
jgi:class III poly(R)-hydroxyalkanoic acid synthase PhaE subunit